MNTGLTKKQKIILKKKLMNNVIFGKAIENMRKQRDIKLVITQRSRNYLVSELNDHATKFFTENLFS